MSLPLMARRLGLLTVIGLGASLSGCGKVMMVALGIHAPQLETRRTIFRQAARQGIDTTSHFYCISPTRLHDVMVGFPRVVIYDQRGNRVANDNCFAMLKEITDSLYRTPLLPALPGPSIAAELQGVQHFSGEPATYDPAGADYTMVYYWGTFLGSLNKSHLAWLEQRVAADKRKNIRLLKVNCDFQTAWNLSREEILRQSAGQ